MARSRMRFIHSVALAGLLAAPPLAAQSTTPPATQTPTPAPAPAPTGDVVGPPQLRDFNLNGAATQPAPPATSTPTPAPAQTRELAPATAPLAEPRTTPAPAATAPARRRPTTAAPAAIPLPDSVTADLAPTETTGIVPEPAFAPEPAPAPAPVAEAPIAADSKGPAMWPWLAALLALGLGAAFWWSRRQGSGRERYATDNAEPGALAATPVAAPEPLARVASPAAQPRSPFPTSTPPLPPQPAVSASPPSAAPPPTPEPVSGGIVASRLKPTIEFELVPISAETDNAEGAALTVDIIVINRGSAPARDVLVEAQMINAGPGVDAEVGRYFLQPAGAGERIPVIPPMASAAIKVRLEVPGGQISPLMVEGRKLLVPLVAINAFYRWSGGELTDSSSFLVGRGDAEGGKMAPFRLDQGARSWTGLAARLHSSGLQR